MNHLSSISSRFPAVLLLSLSVVFIASASLAATITVPLLNISQLQHSVGLYGGARDGASIPGVGVSTSGFQATINTGDHVVVRVQAPIGKRFFVHAPVGASASFELSVYWNSPEAQSADTEEPHIVTFVGIHGTEPTQTYSFVTLGTDRTGVEIMKQYTYSRAFDFTAMIFDITATIPYAPVARNYSVIGSWSELAFVAYDRNADPSVHVMEIVDSATPVQASSWGRIKALYR